MTEPLTPRQQAAKRAWVTMNARKAVLGTASPAALATASAAQLGQIAALIAGEPAPAAKPAKRQKVEVERVGFLSISSNVAMTAGQKAAETRRLHEEAREFARLQKEGVKEESPLAESVMVSWYDEGWRPFVVVGLGEKWATLFQPATLTTLKVARVEFDRYAKPLGRKAPKKSAARVIAARVAEAGKYGFEFNRAVAGRALEAVSY